MPFVIQHPNKTFLVKKNAWSTEWSDNTNKARIFPNQGAATRASKTLNVGYQNATDMQITVRSVSISLN